MFLWRNVANYPQIIPVTPSYLELCSMVLMTDYLILDFLIDLAGHILILISSDYHILHFAALM